MSSEYKYEVRGYRKQADVHSFGSSVEIGNMRNIAVIDASDAHWAGNSISTCHNQVAITILQRLGLDGVIAKLPGGWSGLATSTPPRLLTDEQIRELTPASDAYTQYESETLAFLHEQALALREFLTAK
jgi:hypothetical protein